jgi:predicted Zn-dependent protease with MMP-like domain
MTPIQCSREVFEALVIEALENIPKAFRQRMENLAVTVEWEPPVQIRKELGVPPTHDLLGLYQGLPYTRRGADYGNTLPDKISIYQKPLFDACDDMRTLKTEIRKVVWHEVGHYFGLSEADLERLERDHPGARRSSRRKRP